MEALEANLCKEPTISKTQVPLLERLWQAQSRMERSYARAQHELERLQNSRRKQLQDQPEDETPAPNPEAERPSAPRPIVIFPPVSPVAEAADVPIAPKFPGAEPDSRAAS